MIERRVYNWQCGARTLGLGNRTLIMGILNATPDSFSDGGDYSDTAAAVDRALAMVDEGADIIDVGGESTRPGAEPVALDEEIRRTIPVIEKLRAQSDIPISIDTTKSEIALRALEAGADIINDISALEADARMAEVAARTSAGVVLMHMKGTPQTMQNDPVYTDVVDEVCTCLKQRMDFAAQQGIDRNHLVIDPGIGFAKTVEHNLTLLRSLPELARSCAPLLIGASRKSFLGHLTGQERPAERLAGSLGIAAWAVLQGAHILRVHDVIQTCDVCRIVDTLSTGDT